MKWGQAFFILLFFAVSAFISGCSSQVSLNYIGPDGRNNYENAFISSNGLSSETVNVLGNHLLQDKINEDPEQFIRDLEHLCSNDPSSRNLIALAETSQMIASSMRNDPDQAIKYDLTTLLYTTLYIRQLIEKNAPKLFDPEVIIAVKCYNLALTELFAYLQDRQLHCSGGFELAAAGGQKIHFAKPVFKLPVKANQIASFMLCSDYRWKNLTHDNRRFGIGSPLICDLKNGAFPDTIFAEDQVIPSTLLIKIEPDDKKNDSKRKRAYLIFQDSRANNDVVIKDLQLPLALDFSTPLAYMVRKPQVFSLLQRTFQIEKTRQIDGLYHMEPHHDDRIPIVLVHGLFSDIRTWLQLINTLQSDPELRKNYRFMGFSYSSGNPIFVSAMLLRDALKKEREKLAANNRDLAKFDQMILIGHSMGGLLARLMITNSDDELLSSFIGGKTHYEKIDYSDENFRKLLIFEPLPSVKRVVFIAVPHRGSELARSWIGKVGSSMIKIPQSLLDFNTKLISRLIDINGDTKEDMLKRFNGIDNLSPTGPALQLLNRLPLSNVPYHSIIGNNSIGGIPGGSDGIVPYSSSHLDGAQSEVVVKSDHSVQRNPLAIQEIKRILKVHLKEMERKSAK